MTQLVFFLEEPSAREMLKGVLPKLIPDYIEVKYVVFDGKQDLEKRLPIRLRAWQRPDSLFLILRDQDSGDCKKIKDDLVNKCVKAGQPSALVRIACHELESFYIGDLEAVSRSLGPRNINRLQKRASYRNPDNLANAAEELKKIAPSYQKLAGSRAISPLLNIEENLSNSFHALISGIQRLISNENE